MRHVSYANVIASLALFFAVTGGAYALAVPRNSVGAAQIRAGAVRSSEIARNAVRGGELAPGSVQREDLAFPIGEAAGNGDFATDPVLAKPGETVPLASTRLVTSKPGLIALLSGAVTVSNPVTDGQPATVKVLVRHNGEVEDPVFTASVGDGMSTTIPVSIRCNAVTGENRFSLELLATGAEGDPIVLAGSRALDAASFGPIFHPPPR
jgi:hypothetical protein